MNKVTLIAKTGADITEVMKAVREKYENVDCKFLTELHNPINEASYLVEESNDQVIIFADQNDFPLLLASVVREVAWERGYYHGTSVEHRQYVEKVNIEVYVYNNGSLLRLV